MQYVQLHNPSEQLCFPLFRPVSSCASALELFWQFKVTGIRPMAPVLNRGPLEGISARNVKFFGKERNY